MFASFPQGDKGPFTAPMERGDVITAHCVIQCQSEPFQISICWSDSILYYEKPIPTVAVYIGTLIKSQGGAAPSQRMFHTISLYCYFRWLKLGQRRLIRRKHSHWPRSVFLMMALIWRCAFRTSNRRTYTSVLCCQLSVETHMQQPRNCKHFGIWF